MATALLVAAATHAIRAADRVHEGVRRRWPALRLRDGRSSLHTAAAPPDRLRVCIRWDSDAATDTDAFTPRVTLESRAPGTASNSAVVMQQAVSVESLQPPEDTNTQGLSLCVPLAARPHDPHQSVSFNMQSWHELPIPPAGMTGPRETGAEVRAEAGAEAGAEAEEEEWDIVIQMGHDCARVPLDHHSVLITTHAIDQGAEGQTEAQSQEPRETDSPCNLAAVQPFSPSAQEAAEALKAAKALKGDAAQSAAESLLDHSPRLGAARFQAHELPQSGSFFLMSPTRHVTPNRRFPTDEARMVSLLESSALSPFNPFPPPPVHLKHAPAGDFPWRNWGLTLTANPARIYSDDAPVPAGMTEPPHRSPRTLADVRAILDYARATKQSVRMFGASHSWAPMVCTNGVLVDSRFLNTITPTGEHAAPEGSVAVGTGRPSSQSKSQYGPGSSTSMRGGRAGWKGDKWPYYNLSFNKSDPLANGRPTVTCPPGITTGDLERWMSRQGGAEGHKFPTSTVEDMFSFVGIAALGCHGAGKLHPPMADWVVAMEFVDAEGVLQRVTRTDCDPKFLAAIRLPRHKDGLQQQQPQSQPTGGATVPIPRDGEPSPSPSPVFASRCFSPAQSQPGLAMGEPSPSPEPGLASPGYGSSSSSSSSCCSPQSLSPLQPGRSLESDCGPADSDSDSHFLYQPSHDDVFKALLLNLGSFGVIWSLTVSVAPGKMNYFTAKNVPWRLLFDDTAEARAHLRQIVDNNDSFECFYFPFAFQSQWPFVGLNPMIYVWIMNDQPPSLPDPDGPLLPVERRDEAAWMAQDTVQFLIGWFAWVFRVVMGWRILAATVPYLSAVLHSGLPMSRDAKGRPCVWHIPQWRASHPINACGVELQPALAMEWSLPFDIRSDAGFARLSRCMGDLIRSTHEAFSASSNPWNMARYPVSISAEMRIVGGSEALLSPQYSGPDFRWDDPVAGTRARGLGQAGSGGVVFAVPEIVSHAGNRAWNEFYARMNARFTDPANAERYGPAGVRCHLAKEYATLPGQLAHLRRTYRADCHRGTNPFDLFGAVRDRIDPGRMFCNEFLTQFLYTERPQYEPPRDQPVWSQGLIERKHAEAAASTAAAGSDSGHAAAGSSPRASALGSTSSPKLVFQALALTLALAQALVHFLDRARAQAIRLCVALLCFVLAPIHKRKPLSRRD